jgi:hypothetical protein
LAQRNIKLLFSHVEPELQADLDRHHLTEVIGRDLIFDRLGGAVARYHELSTKAPEPAH